MKCIRCSHDSKYSERQNGGCAKCGGKFAFEPKAGDVFTDAAFEAALARVSSKSMVRFSRAHLHYELVRSRPGPGQVALQSKFYLGIGLAALLLFFAALQSSTAAAAPLLVLAVGVFVYVVVTRRSRKQAAEPLLNEYEVRELLGKWESAHTPPAKLIAPTVRALPAAPCAMAPELTSYSFDRAVVCDRAETVDFLLANNFHFENNCAILSVDGHPSAVFHSVREMLRRNPRIEVYALHDASAEGQGLARKLASSPEWFAGIGRVVDVGISVKHALTQRGMWKARSSLPTEAVSATDKDEIEFLNGYTYELAAIRPEQIIKRLFRAMTQPTDDAGVILLGDGSGLPYRDGSASFYVDASTSDGGGDSFG